MAMRSPVAAARFDISVDGVQIASFSELQGITTKVDAVDRSTRSISPHELTHTIQQNAKGVPVVVRAGKVSAERNGLFKLQSSARKQVKVTAYDGRGTPVAGFTGPLHSATAGGNDVLQQEWSLTYEQIQRVL